MVSGWIARKGPRTAGAFTAATIALAWSAAAAPVALVLAIVDSEFVSVPALAIVGSVAAVPAAAFLGWHYAVDVGTGRSVVGRMSLLVVLLTDLLIFVAWWLVSAVAIIAAKVATEPMIAIGEGVLASAAFALLVFVVGLVIFGLPGLVMAVPSAWAWQKSMRRSLQGRSA
jgi:hypothetical protein